MVAPMQEPVGKGTHAQIGEAFGIQNSQDMMIDWTVGTQGQKACKLIQSGTKLQTPI